MTMNPIKDTEVSNRLLTLGYNSQLKIDEYPGEWSKKDQHLITFSIRKGMNEISMNLKRKTEYFVENMRDHVLDIICSIFLASKRNIGFNEDGSIITTGDLISIKEGTTEVKYDSGSRSGSNSESAFDEMIDFLKTEAYHNLSKYRLVYDL